MYSSHIAKGFATLPDLCTVTDRELMRFLKSTRPHLDFDGCGLGPRDAGLMGLREILENHLLAPGESPRVIYMPGSGNCSECPMLRHYYGDAVKIIAVDSLGEYPPLFKVQVRQAIARNLGEHGSFMERKAQEVATPSHADLILVRHPHPSHANDWRTILKQCKDIPWKKIIMTFSHGAEQKIFDRIVKDTFDNVLVDKGVTTQGLKILTHRDDEPGGPDHCFMVITPKETG